MGHVVMGRPLAVRWHQRRRYGLTRVRWHRLHRVTRPWWDGDRFRFQTVGWFCSTCGWSCNP